jgi:hypothetical protein
MKTPLLIILLLPISIAFAQQWAPSGATTNDAIERNGSITVNGLVYGKYGSAFLGDPNPYNIFGIDAGNKELLFYGNGSSSTLHVRVFDGDLRIGQSQTPNVQFSNNGSGYLNGTLAVGHANIYSVTSLHVKSKTSSPWAVLSEAQNTGRVIGFNHTGSEGVVAVSYLNNEGYTPLQFWTSNVPRMTILTSGYVGIGTVNPDQLLTVNGKVHAREVVVDLSVPGPDYVFEPDYKLLSLSEIEHYIKENKHLPEVPSAKEMEENGLNLNEMNLLLLKKIEEMTLHMIEMQKEIDTLKRKN